MAEPLSSLYTISAAPSLSAFEKLAPPPPENVLAAELAARTSPGDVVIDLHGRGGWVARSGIGALRRVYDLESSPLTRLLAEVVLRPPDLKHYDAAVATLAAHPRGETDLRQALTEPFSSRCPACGRPVIVDEFIWDGSAEVPSRKVFRCTFCREQQRGQEQRSLPLDRDDVARARELRARPAQMTLRARFPIPERGHPLPDELLGLYTARTLVALEALINRLEVDLRAAPIAAALQLALVHSLLPQSKLNSYPGRVAALRIQHGRMRPLGERQWRERNPWLVFEEASRHVRHFLQRIEATTGTFQPRHGDDIDALVEGTANIVLRTGSAEDPDNMPSFWQRPGRTPRFDPRSRVRLVLSQPPVRWTTENLSFAYLATSLVLGYSAAATLPLGGIFGPPPRSAWGREATTLRRSLLAVRPVLADDASAVLMLDRGGPAGLVAGVLGGVGAGFTLSSALLNEIGDEIDGLLEFSLARPPEAQIGDDGQRALTGATGPPPDAPFQLADVERAVTDVAVAVLQARGEPARGERLLGEVLVGLDRLGHLRRLAATDTFAESEAQAQPLPLAPVVEPGEAPPEPDERAEPESAEDQAEPRGAEDHAEPPAAHDHGDRPAAHDHGERQDPDGANPQATEDQSSPDEPEAAEPPAWALSPRSAHDHVRLLMEIVMGELRRADNSRLLELEPGRWWLRDPQDVSEARQPLSDRLEWAIFGLLSTSQGMNEQQFFERIARMYRGHDAPDEELVRSILDSYRDHSATGGRLRTADELAARHREHGGIIGMLVEYGHRLGMRAWVSEHEQRRAYRDATVGDLLSEEERRAYLPLIATGDARTLETLDCMWYVRGRANFVFEVEWTGMLGEALLARGPSIQTDERLVRFLVIPDERAELVRLKLDRSPLLRRALDNDNWHILKWSNVRRLHALEEASLEAMGPMLGLDPEVEKQPEQMQMFDLSAPLVGSGPASEREASPADDGLDGDSQEAE